MDNTTKIFIIPMAEEGSVIDELGEIPRNRVFPSLSVDDISSYGSTRLEVDRIDASCQTTMDLDPKDATVSNQDCDIIVSPVLRIQKQEVIAQGTIPVLIQPVLKEYFDISFWFCFSPIPVSGAWKDLLCFRQVTNKLHNINVLGLLPFPIKSICCPRLYFGFLWPMDVYIRLL